VPLSPGDPVRVLMTKWPDRPHSAFTGTWLGVDDHGAWVGARAGTACFRGGAQHPAAVHVDITTPAAWDGASVTAVDLDLDVARQVGGEVLVADEDEFEERAPAYPPDVVAAARASLVEVRAALEALRTGAPA
jgi:uncharacterized protein